MQTVNLQEKLSLIHEFWTPKIVGELNGQQVKLAKLHGEFVWHAHDDEDELFYVLQGTLTIEFRDRVETINAGEFIIVKRGVEHRPVALEEVSVMLFEPATTINTGKVTNELTQLNLDRI